MRDAHVVRPHVDHQSHAAALQLTRHTQERVLIANLGIEKAVVCDVVAVHAARPSHQERRSIQVTDTELIQILNQFSRLLKGEGPIELEPVSGGWSIDGLCFPALHGILPLLVIWTPPSE